HGRGDLQPRVQRIRLRPAGGGYRRYLPGAGGTLHHRRVPVRRDADPGHDGPGGGLHRHAGPQGPVRPPGNRRTAVREGRPRPHTAGGRHRQHLYPAGDAGLPAGSAGGGHPQYARHRRAAG
ncbi:HTH-type transcriptional regulator immR, partial [Dysosmobacter welbionis]